MLWVVYGTTQSTDNVNGGRPFILPGRLVLAATTVRSRTESRRERCSVYFTVNLIALYRYIYHERLFNDENYPVSDVNTTLAGYELIM
jgi:hypothetical protein